MGGLFNQIFFDPIRGEGGAVRTPFLCFFALYLKKFRQFFFLQFFQLFVVHDHMKK